MININRLVSLSCLVNKIAMLTKAIDMTAPINFKPNPVPSNLFLLSGATINSRVNIESIPSVAIIVNIPAKLKA